MLSIVITYRVLNILNINILAITDTHKPAPPKCAPNRQNRVTWPDLFAEGEGPPSTRSLPPGMCRQPGVDGLWGRTPGPHGGATGALGGAGRTPTGSLLVRACAGRGQWKQTDGPRGYCGGREQTVQRENALMMTHSISPSYWPIDFFFFFQSIRISTHYFIWQPVLNERPPCAGHCFRTSRQSSRQNRQKTSDFMELSWWWGWEQWGDTQNAK